MKRLGAITIGQSPRDDIIPEMIPYLGDVEIIQAGALDALSYEEILKLKPEDGDYVLVSKLNDGRSVNLGESNILPLLQDCIEKLEAEGADAIIFLCTGEFPDVFKTSKPIFIPERILLGATLSLVNKGKVGVIIPDKDQKKQCIEKWSQAGVEAVVVNGSPYKGNDEIDEAIKELNKETNIDVIALDCMGYTQEMKNRVSKRTGKPVILSRTIVARVIGEILDAI